MNKPNPAPHGSDQPADDDAKSAIGSKGGQSDKSESGFIAAETNDAQTGKKQFRKNPPEPAKKPSSGTGKP